MHMQHATCYIRMHLQARKAVLEKYANGMDDFVCCQGYCGPTAP